ncbi:MAG: hypothetical protein ACRC0V_07345 [Fusobacteriaceae bacterium]
MKKVNQDKADQLEKFLTELLLTCGGKCENCALENVCDMIDVLNLNLRFTVISDT